MRKIFYPLITVFIFFSSIHASAGIDDFNSKNYVYDDEGNPIFIKIYIESHKEKCSNRNNSGTHFFPQQDGLQLTLNRMTQDDQRGSYIVIPIKRKKDNDDDDKDESTWECPYCHRENKASSNRCGTKGCVLNR